MRPGIWLDEKLPSADLTPPVTQFRTPGWLRALIVVGVVAVIIGLIVALGGFRHRTDVLETRRPGTVLQTGPFEIVLHEVTAQRVQDWDEEWEWQIRLRGEIRNVWSEAEAYRMGEHGWMAWRQPATQEIVIPQSVVRAHTNTYRVPPTGDWFATEWVGTAEDDPSAYLQVHMLDLEYTDNSLLGFGTRVWNPASVTYETWVPVIRLPDKSYS